MTALEAAAAALARRDRAAADLVAHLVRKGFAADEAETAVRRLHESGYVDDGRYVARRAELLAERGYGDEAIRARLGQDGVEDDAIAAALDALPPERDRALAALPAVPTAAALRRLAAKGFTAEALEAAAALLD